MSGVTGGDAVVRMMVAFKEGVRPKLLETMNAVAIDLAGYIKASKLSGQVLNVRSGRLRRSVAPSVDAGASEISAITSAGGTNVKYARAHEYGYRGNVVVSAYHRMQTMAWGKPMKNPREVLVNQHSSFVNLPERSFMRSGLRDRAPSGVDRIRKSMADLAAEVRS